jgi:hypothetical protein
MAFLSFGVIEVHFDDIRKLRFLIRVDAIRKGDLDVSYLSLLVVGNYL